MTTTICVSVYMKLIMRVSCFIFFWRCLNNMISQHKTVCGVDFHWTRVCGYSEEGDPPNLRSWRPVKLQRHDQTYFTISLHPPLPRQAHGRTSILQESACFFFLHSALLALLAQLPLLSNLRIFYFLIAALTYDHY